MNNNWFKDSKTDIKPPNPKSSWIKGADGKEDAVPRQYLNAKADAMLNPSRKNPWDK